MKNFAHLCDNLRGHLSVNILSFPCIDRLGAYSFLPVSLFVHVNFYVCHSFWIVTVRAFIFDMSIPVSRDKTFLLVTSSSHLSRSKYQGHSLKKNGRCRCIHIFFLSFAVFSICILYDQLLLFAPVLCRCFYFMQFKIEYIISCQRVIKKKSASSFNYNLLQDLTISRMTNFLCFHTERVSRWRF